MKKLTLKIENKKAFKYFVISSAISLISSVTNLWFFLNRGRIFAIYSPKPYYFFYNTARPQIKFLEYKDGVLEGKIEFGSKKFFLANEPLNLNIFKIPVQENTTLIFKDSQQKNYRLKLVFHYYPKKDANEVINCKTNKCSLQVELTDFEVLPVGPPFTYWIPSYSSFPMPKLWTEKLLKIKNTSLTLEEKLKIWTNFSLPFFVKNMGIPSRQMIKAPPSLQIKKLLEQNDKVWCSNIAEINAYSLNYIGIPTRVVQIFGKVGSLPLRPHMVNEVFDLNTQQWFLFDLTCNIVYVKDCSGKKLNLIQLNRHIYEQTIKSLVFCYWNKTDSKIALADYTHLPAYIKHSLEEFYQGHQFFIYPSSSSYIFNRTNKLAKIKDYVFGYRYIYSPVLSFKLWILHIIFRSTFYLSVFFAFTCVINFFIMIKFHLTN